MTTEEALREENRRYREALIKAHACGTLRDDGTCVGCFVSEALTSTAAPPPVGPALPEEEVAAYSPSSLRVALSALLVKCDREGYSRDTTASEIILLVNRLQAPPPVGPALDPGTVKACALLCEPGPLKLNSPRDDIEREHGKRLAARIRALLPKETR
jgi:hypothetical protein